MVAQMRNVGNWNIQKPNHNIVSFLVDEETDIDPIGHHQDGDGEDCGGKDVGKQLTGVDQDGVVDERGINCY